MQKNSNFKVPQGLIYLGFLAGLVLVILSSIFTAILFESFASGTWIGKILAVAGICIDIGKIVSASTFVYFVMKGKFGIATASLVIYIFAFGISMIASQSLDLNKANEIRQSTIIASDDYGRNVETYEDSKKSIANIQAQIDNLRTSKQSKIDNSADSLLSERATAKKNYWITTPKGSPRRGVDIIDRDISSIKKTTESKVDSEINELETKVSTLQNLKLSSKQDLESLKTSGVIATKGMLSFAEWVHAKGYGKDAMDVLGWFYLFKNVFTEVLGTFLMMLMNYNFDDDRKVSVRGFLSNIKGRLKKSEQLDDDFEDVNGRNIGFEPTPTPSLPITNISNAYKPVKLSQLQNNSDNKYVLGKHDFKPSPTLRSIQEKKIGFDTKEILVKRTELVEPQGVQPNVIIDEEIQMYLDFMYNRENQSIENVSPGYMKISKNIKLTADKCRKIKDHLEKMGIVQVSGGKTNIVLAKKQAEKVLSLKLNV